MYMVFDLLELDGKDLRTRPLRERREALERRVAGHQLIIPVRRLPSNGLEAWDEVLRCNYEGMVAKDTASTYTPGRTLSWLKVKQRELSPGCSRLPQRLTQPGTRRAAEDRFLGGWTTYFLRRLSAELTR
jgi:ATP-dependent DNA ligase